MNFSQQDLDPNDAYLPAPDGNAAASPWRLYVEFIAFVFQSTLESVSLSVVNVWRQPVLRALLLFACGSVVVWGISWIDKPQTTLRESVIVESTLPAQPAAAEETPAGEGLAAAPAPVEEPALPAVAESAIIPVAQQVDATGFMPVSFTVSGELVAGTPLTFSVVDHVPGRKYQINFGNGIKKEMGTSLTYTYPKKGIFLVELIVQEGGELRSSDQVIQIKAAEVKTTDHTDATTSATSAPDTESSETQSFHQEETPAEGTDEAASAQDFRPADDLK